MSWRIIRPQIKTLLETSDNFGEVSSFPKLKFDAYPAAYIVPSDNASAYETTHENQRIYAFTLRMFYETKSTGVDTGLANLETIVDEILDLIDLEDLKSSDRTIAKNLGSNKTFLGIEAAPTGWGEVPEESLLLAEITIRVRISVDVS